MPYDLSNRFDNVTRKQINSAGWAKDTLSPNIVKANGPYEEWILSEAFSRRGAPEVLHIKTLDLNGQTTSSASGLGVGSSGTISLDSFGRVYDSLAIPRSAKIIEVNHVHPGYEFQSYNLKEPAKTVPGSISPLSDEDLAILHRVSVDHPSLYVRMRATLPNGYTYQRTMKNGKFTTDPNP